MTELIPKRLSMRDELKFLRVENDELKKILGEHKAKLRKSKGLEIMIDCPECDGKGTITKTEGLKIDIDKCGACQGEKELFFTGIGDFYIPSKYAEMQKAKKEGKK